jgi:mRNA-degrading endonuclease RelE of RelBE toxin-antitoxin system
LAVIFSKKNLSLIGLSLILILMRPFQIIFNPTSASELSKMPKELQLYILGEFRGLPQEVLKSDMEKYGRLERAGRQLHRFRLGDYRVYFERNELGVLVYRILNRNTLKDFLYRSNLPIREDQVLQENPKFWELIEAARTPAKPITHKVAA